MPLVEISLANGRSPDQIRRLLRDVHRAVADPTRLPGHRHPRHRPGGLLSLLPTGSVEPDVIDAVKNYDNRGSMARIHLLIDELPEYIAFPPGQGPQHEAQQIMGASVENFERAWEAERRGVLPHDFVIEAMSQSTTDPSLAPAGKHTMTLGVQQLPFELTGTTWDEMREPFADRVLENLYRYAPNMRDHILERVVITPLDLQRDYGVTGENIFHGAMFLEQLLGDRPTPTLADYRTPVKGYYLCGSGTHPGGGVMGVNGHNAAKVVLGDMDGSGTEHSAGITTRPRTGSHLGVADSVMKTRLGRELGSGRPPARAASAGARLHPERNMTESAQHRHPPQRRSCKSPGILTR